MTRVSEAEIARALARSRGLLIDGAVVQAADGATMPTVDPAKGTVTCMVPSAGPADVDRAVAAAKRAQPAWNALAYRTRREALQKVAARLAEHQEGLAILDVLDTGNVIAGMRQDVLNGIDVIDYFGAIGHEVKGEVTQLDQNLHYTRREPFGVVLRLLPFNHPIASAVTAMVPPLLMGNAVVLKPSPHSPLSALALSDLVKDVLPPGVLSILSGDNERVAVPLIRHSGIDRITVIGGVETGKAIMRMAADRLTPLTLELGAKNPLIVFPDADVSRSVEVAIAGMNFRWQGHSCASTSRVLVHRKLEKDFLGLLAERVAKIRVGDPLEAASEMGAISTRALYDRCLSYVALGREEGARLLTGGERPRDASLAGGYFMTPAVFGGASPDMRIAREEMFGPIITVMSWDDYGAMIETVNGLDVGFTAVLMTNDLELAHRTAGALQVGYVEINGPMSYALGSPVGGVKQTGFGREGDIEELLSYTTRKSVNVRLGTGVTRLRS